MTEPIQNIDSFKLVKQFSSNNKVYLAQDINDSSVQMIVKEVKESRRYKDGLVVYSKLQHSNIAKLLGTFTRDKNMYIMTEYINGVDLAEMDKTDLDDESFFYIAREILNGLVYMHSENIIHTDIKPENIMIGNYPPQIKIIDFDTSKYDDGKQRYIVGTCIYKPPNEMTSVSGIKKIVDRSTDIWSLGATLFYLYTGGKDIKDIIFEPLYNPHTFETRKRELVMGQDEIDGVVNDHIYNKRVKKFLLNMLILDQTKRKTSRQMLRRAEACLRSVSVKAS